LFSFSTSFVQMDTPSDAFSFFGNSQYTVPQPHQLWKLDVIMSPLLQVTDRLFRHECQ
jgi:hypothetical protein